MRRADRLFQIVQLLRGGRLVTAQRLAEELEVSKRTIYRDIADLQGTGVPIEGEAGVGYVLQDGFDLPPLMFDTDEIVALVAGARMIRAWGGSAMARAAQEALIKIETVLPDAARARAQSVQVHSLGLGMEPEVRARIDRIEAAIEARNRLHIAYADEAGAQTTRVLRPLGLWFWAPAWTLVA
jgi:predicted DNA-binding transcriptional regulator YafY